MTVLPRRVFLKSAVAGMASVYGLPASSAPAGGAAAQRASKPTSNPVSKPTSNPVSKPALLHATDLFRPHADPDDHFDLATVFSLAFQDRIDLRAVMIDYPPAVHAGDPDVLAVAQMNRIAGLSVPVITGSSERLDPAEAAKPGNRAGASGAFALLEILRRSPGPAAISIVGSCRDVALAGRLEPDLFAAKCAGVYLNAGSGTPDKSLAARLEYNVGLDPGSYAAIFDLPCPLYWLPCFEVAPGGDVRFAVAEYGTYYRFLQNDILPLLSTRLQNYFAFLFKQGESDRTAQNELDALRPDWLRYLEGPREEALLERQGKQFRNMWSTAGFLHAAGLAVSADGAVVPLDAVASAAYSFEPVRVRCGADGITEWSPDPRSRDRFIFRVRDVGRYPAAMTAALMTLLRALP